MNSIFVYCELEGVQVAPVSQELLTKGRSLANQLGVKLEALAIGSGLDGIEKQILPYGVDVLHIFDDKSLACLPSHPRTVPTRACS
ncbi:MAG: hypothetical protein II040_09400 [Muribaculaceae bacterium]|nr:hypothetical protein [Muribaculaceae bacterium]